MSHTKNNARSQAGIPKSILKHVLSSYSDHSVQWAKNTEQLVHLNYILFIQRLAHLAFIHAKKRFESTHAKTTEHSHIVQGKTQTKTKRTFDTGQSIGFQVDAQDILAVLPCALKEYSG